MLNPEADRQYWFIRPKPGHSGNDPGEPAAVLPFVRHSYGASNFWRSALEALYELGFLEVEEARAAGLVPPDWDVAPDVRAQHPHVERKGLFEQIMEGNRMCLRIAAAGPICPHCGDRGKIRFIDRLTQIESSPERTIESLRQQQFLTTFRSHFICNTCARSFGQIDPQDIQTTETTETTET